MFGGAGRRALVGASRVFRRSERTENDCLKTKYICAALLTEAKELSSRYQHHFETPTSDGTSKRYIQAGH